ncbi:MAG: hypothetical protein R3F30_12750 [Planctomycetota bacterium]
MAGKGTGYDGSGSEPIALSGRRKGALFQVTAYQHGDGGAALGPSVVGLTGRDLILKYTKVPTVPDWQLAKLMDFEVEQIAAQAGGNLSADYNLLPVADG